MAREIPVDPLGLARETIGDWIFPYFIRADILALRYQRWFRWLSTAIFALAAAAVVVVAGQANLWPGRDWGPLVEALCLLSLLFVLGINYRMRLQDRWISSRFLAERLRSSYFLALAGTGDGRLRSTRIAYLSDSSEAWIERALTEVSARRPELDGTPPVTALRDYLNDYWIGSQITYQEKASRLRRKYDEWLVFGTVSIFALTLFAAIFHIVINHYHPFDLTPKEEKMSCWPPSPSRRSAVLSTGSALSARSAAIPNAIGPWRGTRPGTGRDDRSHHGRTGPGGRGRDEQVMREENSDWFGVMRFHDMELIT